MPLTPATTDKLLKVGLPGTATTLAAPGYTTGVTTAINVGATTNWPTDTPTIFAMDAVTVVNGVATRTPGTYGEFFGIVTGSTTIGSLLLRYGTPQNYVAGSLTRVYIPVAGTRENDLIDAIRQDHNGKGNHQTLTDDNSNPWLGRNQVASAVNYPQVSNAIAGAAPAIAAVGADTNVDLKIDGKGTGVVKVGGAVPQKYAATWNFIESGCVWTANAVGSTLVASMSAGFVWIGGKRLSVAAVVSRSFTLSSDTYIDFKDNGDGTANVTYTVVANNAASPALASSGTFFDTLRNGIIVTAAANIATINKVNNGQLRADAPVVATCTLTVNDSIGNLIGNRSPLPRLLGYRIGAATAVAGTGSIAIPGTLCPVVLPIAFRRVKGTLNARDHYNTTASQYSGVNMNNNTDSVQIGPGTFTNSGGVTIPANTTGYDSPLTTNPTYQGFLSAPGAGTANLEAPIVMMVEID
jgi:hypothetical protein